MKRSILFFISIFISSLIAFSQCDYSYGKWDTSLSSMHVDRAAFPSVIYHDSVFLFGGVRFSETGMEQIKSVDVYDPAHDTWNIKITELPSQYVYSNACQLEDKIYIMGARHVIDNETRIHDSVYIYDIHADSWEAGQSIPNAVAGFGADTINGKIYVAGGGTDNWGVVSSLYVYDPLLDEWTEKAAMNVSRRAPCAQSWNGKLYVFGGYSGPDWIVSNSIEVYDPEQDQWTLLTPSFTPSTIMGMSLFDNQLLVIGGVHGYSGSTYNYTDFISGYHLSSDSWLEFHSSGDNIPAKRQFPATACMNDKVYVFGGMLDGISRDNVWAYSLKSIRQYKEIEDIVFDSESIEINLSDYFSSIGEEELKYSICEGYNEEVIDASIDNSILLIERQTQDVASTEIVVNACNTEDTVSSNSFNIQLPVGIQNLSIHKLSVYPNPASEKVAFRYYLADAGNVSLEIYNSSGQVMERIQMQKMAAGDHQIVWKLEGYINGMYFVQLKSRKSTSVSKLLINH